MNGFPNKVIDSFVHDKFKLGVEKFESIWSFTNQSGECFKLSNIDLSNTLRAIIENWDKWEKQNLNQNNVNPDVTLYNFFVKNIEQGAPRSLAKVQRRGFLHLINSVAYAANNSDSFDQEAWGVPLEKEDYIKALEILEQYSKVSAGVVFDQSGKIDRAIEDLDDFLDGGENLIFYGAPGTGKSYTVEKLIDEHRTIRTVFHPDTQNSDFIGALKPIIVDGDVSYAFSPGPFSKSMVAAYNQPSVMHYLVIEELNRAPAAAVFGELFQMLDRDGNGTGEYSVDFPSEEFVNWWQARTSRNESKMRLPSNLSILATMNSADQGVFPLDTAFRRRWKQEYIPIDYDNVPAGHVQIALKAGDIVNVSWGIFIKKLNNFLVDQIGATISEDRLIGPWFLSSAELDGAIPNKLLIYLWDDLLRHHGREIIFASRIKTVGSFANAQKDKKPIFSGAFLALFQNDLGVDE